MSNSTVGNDQDSLFKNSFNEQSPVCHRLAYHQFLLEITQKIASQFQKYDKCIEQLNCLMQIKYLNSMHSIFDNTE